MKSTIILFTLTLAALTVPTARADLLDNIALDIRFGRRAPPPPPAVVVVVEDTGPRGPAQWERSRWYQRPQGYYYYPGGDVYYRRSDHVWFFQERGRWRSGRNLPDYIRIDFNRSVSINMATDRPYTYHHQVVAKYPSNYFGTRVRLRDDDRHDRGNGHRGDNGRGRDNRGRDNDRRDESNDRKDRR